MASLYDLLLATAGTRLTSRNTTSSGSRTTYYQTSWQYVERYSKKIHYRQHQTWDSRNTQGYDRPYYRNTYTYKDIGGGKRRLTTWLTYDPSYPGVATSRPTAYNTRWTTDQGPNGTFYYQTENIPIYGNTSRQTSRQTYGESSSWNTAWEVDD